MDEKQPLVTSDQVTLGNPAEQQMYMQQPMMGQPQMMQQPGQPMMMQQTGQPMMMQQPG